MLVNGSISQDLPLRLKARARIDYSSNLQLNNLYSRDIYNATQSLSTVTGNVAGSWQFLNASLTGTSATSSSSARPSRSSAARCRA